MVGGTTLDQAERLKTEGNALFVKNDFTGAYQKYTEAIKYDKKNAILYCNRAACAFGLNRYPIHDQIQPACEVI